MLFSTNPGPQGLYDPAHEHDACGVGVVAHAKGERSHAIVADALRVLHNLDHRGAAGSEPTSGDGAGILLQVPDALIRATATFELPEPVPAADGGPPELAYATGLAFLPADADGHAKAVSLLERIVAEENLEVLGWRAVPVDPEGADVGSVARSAMPRFGQIVVASPDRALTGLALDRIAWIVRKRAERESVEQDCGLYLASLSSRTITYKGMLTTDQLPAFFPDLRDERLECAVAVVHSRFSTNTFPSWPLAHPYRTMAHNGEINTIKANRNRMRAREALLGTDRFPGDLQRAMPVCPPDASDSASFDEVLELLYLGGRSLPHAVMMMMPEAWENHAEMPADQRAFYRFHASLMEPWDGPAAVVFTDGRLVGATLDRNGLRPARWWHLADDRVVLASESGVLEVEPSQVVAKGRLRPGRMFLVDTVRGELVDDEAFTSGLAAEEPYSEWLHAGLVRLEELPSRDHVVHTHESVVRRQQAFGYTEEDLRVLLAPMATTGAEPLGSMGTDTPTAALSTRARLLYDYFVQLFAQVTNPPLDAIREELVTSMARAVGPEQNLFHPGPASCRQVVLPHPVLDNDDLAKLIHINDDRDMPGFAATVLSGLYEVDGGEQALADALDRVRREASAAIADGKRILVLSDRDSDHRLAPIPALLLVSAVHHHLVATRERTQAALVVECGDAREVHHVALLLGFGAAAVNPYLAFESIEDMIAGGWLDDLESSRPSGTTSVRWSRASGRSCPRWASPRSPGTRRRRSSRRSGSPRSSSTSTSPAPRPSSAAAGSTSSRSRSPSATGGPTRPTRESGRTATSTSAVSTPTAGRASCTCSARRRCSSCSTRRAPTSARCSVGTPTRSTAWSVRAGPCGGCSGCGPSQKIHSVARRCRSRRWSPRPRSSSASPPAACPTARSPRSPTPTSRSP